MPGTSAYITVELLWDHSEPKEMSLLILQTSAVEFGLGFWTPQFRVSKNRCFLELRSRNLSSKAYLASFGSTASTPL